ncbi:zinc finger CCCH domain-containing protein 53-like isoform X1 [Cucurbita pepo subsp. pepo]|uniref:zinc finger CCCH domain-containing protein 53-like isoform X1 n=1 Tax=Cucurbita pepo subsp. pepo TaxID=3664 RepID=UPI000C9D8CED|nr:zinc finger CCCH domain-containing protein 53-like isoform X1 [Cucurbita pepo subsp. pepo]XP_023552022.1 zinc finger CCCH domain-containing protein 53-like isoform X1 [Cucurbita pepo subsp. pepo]
MDSYEATRTVFSRIQNLDPENASKIMGLLLIQDHGEKEMIRLAFGSESLLHSVILKARKDLGLPSVNSPSTPSTPSSSPSPFSLSTNPIAISRQSSSSRLGINLPPSLTIPSPSSSSSASWAPGFNSKLQSFDDHLISPGNLPLGSSCFGAGGTPTADIIDEFQLQDQLSFLNDGSPTIGVKNSDLFFPPADLSSSPTGGFGNYGGDASWDGGPFHRRSYSVNDAGLGTEDLNCGLGWKPCLYYARGFCKNGTSCRFLHGGLGDSDGCAAVGSPSKIEMMEQCHELLRSKSSAQQRLAAASQLMASANSFPYSPKSINFLLQQQQNNSQRAAAAALIMGEDLHKFGRSSRLEQNEFSLNGGAGIVNPASRQIYLTFPADSTFKEEDVSNYFSMYGPVQDVRIPYQQKRMFGFVTFVYPETVKLILAKGNPHFVCDARVLVKPYKEKGKVPDKYRKQQQIDRDYSPCGTPTGLDSRELYDHLQLGSRMFYNSHQDLLWRRKLEEQQADLQTLDLQSRRLLNLQLLDVKKNQLPHHHRALSTGSPIPSPTHSPNPFAQNHIFPTIRSSSSSTTSDILRGEVHNPISACGATPVPVRTPPPIVTMSSTDMPRQPSPVDNRTSTNKFPSNGQGEHDKERSQIEDSDLLECFEHNLPDSPFASPAKAPTDYAATFSVEEAANDSDDASSSSILTPTPSREVAAAASFKSFNCQMPRFPTGHSTIGMYAGTGGPTCPVGI